MQQKECCAKIKASFVFLGSVRIIEKRGLLAVLQKSPNMQYQRDSKEEFSFFRHGTSFPGILFRKQKSVITKQSSQRGTLDWIIRKVSK